MKDIGQTTKNSAQHHWVWHSTEQSTANGQISILAIIETLLSVALYFWLAQHFERQWWWLLTALAAPILLLRSEESKRLGLRWFLSYFRNIDNSQPLSRPQNGLILVISFTFSITIAYWLALQWLADYKGITVLAYTFIVGFLVQQLGIGVAAALSIVIDRTTLIAIPYALMLALITKGIKLNTVEGLSILLAAIAGFSTGTHTGTIAVGVLLRSLTIRVTASLRYLTLGLAHLPDNFRELLWITDITREPEFLPGLNQTLPGIRLKSLLGRKKTYWYISAATLYGPAIIWRWSLKSTLWLWWPIVLLIRQPLANQSPELVRDHAAARVSGSGKLVSYSAGFIAVWLLINQWPQLADWLALLPEPYAKLSEDLLTRQAPPPQGIRTFLLGIASLVGLMTGWQAMLLKAMHKQVLEEETSFAELPKQRQDLFASRARHLERWHTTTVVALIALGYAVLAWLANTITPSKSSITFIPGC